MLPLSKLVALLALRDNFAIYVDKFKLLTIHQTVMNAKLVICTKRAAGIEPALLAWKAKVLPLNYARKLKILITGRDLRKL